MVIITIIFSIALWILFLWLSSRGRFMFLYCIAEKRAEVKVPWNKYIQQGNSLCVFMLILGIIAAVCIGLLIVPLTFSAILFSEGNMAMLPGILAIVFFGLIALAAVIVFALIGKFTRDFVVPIMYLRGCSSVEGWRIFLPILKAHAGIFTLYILFYLLILFAITMIVNIVVVCTCCCAACFLAIPYIGTVLMLPLLVFERSYSLYFLSQFGPEWDVFAAYEVVPLPKV